MKTTLIHHCLIAALSIGVTVSPAFAVTWCHDYSVYRISNKKENPNELDVGNLRKYLLANKYLPFKYDAAAGVGIMKPGDVIILDDDHSGFVNNKGLVDHFIQVEGKTGRNAVAYDPNNLPRPVANKRGGLFEGDTLKDMLGRLYIQKPRTVIVWRKAPEYEKGKRLGSAVLLAKKDVPTDVGVKLEAGKPYIIVGEGSCSLWSNRTEGCDSVFRHSTPLEANGGAIIPWGQLKLVDPTLHLYDAIKNQTGKEPVYNKAHVYEAVVLGEGKNLKALVYDGGNYGDNAGHLTITVYEAVPKRR